MAPAKPPAQDEDEVEGDEAFEEEEGGEQEEEGGGQQEEEEEGEQGAGEGAAEAASEEALVPAPAPPKNPPSLRRHKKLRALLLSKYDAVWSQTEAMGWTAFDAEHEEGCDYNVCWSDTSVALERIMKMGRLQKINHFPGMLELVHTARAPTIYTCTYTCASTCIHTCMHTIRMLQLVRKRADPRSLITRHP